MRGITQVHKTLRRLLSYRARRPVTQTKLLEISAITLSAGQKNDLHVYDPASTTWLNLSSHALGTPPSAREGHGFASAEGKLYVHGGYDESGVGI